MDFKNLLFIILSAVFVNNYVLQRFLGICPFLGVSKKLDQAAGTSIAVIFVMLLATAVTWPTQTFLLDPNDLGHLQTIVFILVIAALVQAADAISAARPGARRENLENYIKRVEKLEEIAKSYDGVEKCYAIQAGREIRILVKPEAIKDDEMVIAAREIAKRIESELEYPGQIKVHMIRESRAIDYAK